MARITWHEVPPHVRTHVDRVLGDDVVEAVCQPGGYSPGSADRVLTRSGLRAFVKAVSPAQNPDSPTLHRREIEVTRALPSSARAPSLLGSYDDGDWVALILEDVDGVHPDTPWRPEQLEWALDSLDALADVLTPFPLARVPTAREVLADEFAGWERLAADPPSMLEEWVADEVERWRRLAQQGVDALDGDTLVHCDVRADNLLVRPGGEVVLVDWPHACRGPRWLDTVMLLANVDLTGGHDVEELLHSRRLTADVDAPAVSGVLAGLAGFLLDRARRPAPPGLPTIRDFQRDQGEALLGWLRRRHG